MNGNLIDVMAENLARKLVRQVVSELDGFQAAEWVAAALPGLDADMQNDIVELMSSKFGSKIDVNFWEDSPYYDPMEA